MTKACLFVFCFPLIPGIAFANPIRAVQVFSAERLGEHVRLSYVTNCAYDPEVTKTYGSSRSEWFSTGDSLSENTGSGTESMAYEYLCDCHVPSGTDTLKYVLGFRGGEDLYATARWSGTVSSSACDAQCTLADAKASAGGDSDGRAAGAAKEAGGSCAIAHRGRGGALMLLLAMGLVAVRLRRGP